MIIATVKPPDNMEYWSFSATTKNIPPNNPYTIDGIPAKHSVANLIISTIFPFLASEMKQHKKIKNSQIYSVIKLLEKTYMNSPLKNISYEDFIVEANNYNSKYIKILELMENTINQK